MQRHDLPSVSAFNARLAQNNARVTKLLDRLPQQIDALVAAMEREDWSEVRRLGEYLARSGKTYDLPHLHRPAQALCDGLNQPQDTLAVCRHVLHLIGAYGRLRSQSPA